MVLPNGNVLTIEGGTEAGSNLFHSFQEFSIPMGNEAFFNNAPTIDNIITRVTGGNLSNIDGLIRANGTANLFLMNPNGIQFGPNARLEIGGSFLGSTASSLLFEDGNFYSATEPDASPLLSINVPVGLQMGSNPGAIAVGGTGYTISNENPRTFATSNGLRVNPEQTIALVGGEVIFDGGAVTTDSGRVELGSVRSGVVGLEAVSNGWILDYEEADSFGDIQLLSMAFADASGNGSGSIQVRGRNISLLGGSRLFIQSRGSLSGGAVRAIASESLEFVGSDTTGNVATAILTQALGTGNGANILVSTPTFLLSEEAVIGTQTFSPARGGNITIDASESILLRDVSPIEPINSNIATESVGAGTAGNIEISTEQLLLMDDQTIISAIRGTGRGGDISISAENLSIIDGSGISTFTLGPGQGGDLEIEAESIFVSGFNFDLFTASSLSASTLGTGNAGNLTIDTGTLVVRDGGRIDSSTLASGSAGRIAINASDFVEVSGTVPGAVNPSIIVSSANIVDEALQQFFGVPAIPSGNSGNVTIETPQLRVTEGGTVTVRNDGTGNAGTLGIEAGSILLDGTGSITASTQSGEGGNISLSLNDLQLRNDSFISTEAGGSGDGGNLSLNSNTIALLENSRITANALEGTGGNIDITTNGLFVAPDSQITASSQFGVDGTVAVNNPVVDPASGLIALDSDTLNPNTQIQDSCDIATRSRFTFAGSGGLPEDPTQILQPQTVWRDTRLGEIQSHLTQSHRR